MYNYARSYVFKFSGYGVLILYNGECVLPGPGLFFRDLQVLQDHRPRGALANGGSRQSVWKNLEHISHSISLPSLSQTEQSRVLKMKAITLFLL